MSDEFIGIKWPEQLRYALYPLVRMDMAMVVESKSLSYAYHTVPPEGFNRADAVPHTRLLLKDRLPLPAAPMQLRANRLLSSSSVVPLVPPRTFVPPQNSHSCTSRPP